MLFVSADVIAIFTKYELIPIVNKHVYCWYKKRYILVGCLDSTEYLKKLYTNVYIFFKKLSSCCNNTTPTFTTSMTLCFNFCPRKKAGQREMSENISYVKFDLIVEFVQLLF